MTDDEGKGEAPAPAPDPTAGLTEEQQRRLAEADRITENETPFDIPSNIPSLRFEENTPVGT